MDKSLGKMIREYVDELVEIKLNKMAGEMEFSSPCDSSSELFQEHLEAARQYARELKLNTRLKSLLRRPLNKHMKITPEIYNSIGKVLMGNEAPHHADRVNEFVRSIYNDAGKLIDRRRER